MIATCTGKKAKPPGCGVVDTSGIRLGLSLLVEKKRMNVAINLPDDIGRQLAMKWPDVPRGVMEAIAVEGSLRCAYTWAS